MKNTASHVNKLSSLPQTSPKQKQSAFVRWWVPQTLQPTLLHTKEKQCNVPVRKRQLRTFIGHDLSISRPIGHSADGFARWSWQGAQKRCDSTPRNAVFQFTHIVIQLKELFISCDARAYNSKRYTGILFSKRNCLNALFGSRFHCCIASSVESWWLWFSHVWCRFP